ncbi:MAG TPA: SurA N-terminal domain-containing protein [Pyrinomonadaceae bacterium]|jgi:peptidyl-prolyl cis-trans isomerase D|nr:SurA N-terminal domain-containing protein [Pyrinomonadaceae bacterium]
MLKFFSRLEKTRNVLIIFFAALVVVGMVVAGVYNRSGAAVANPFRSREVLAKVGSEEVTVADYTLLKKKMESQFGGNFSLAQLGMTGERILDQAINSRIALQEARRLGLTASDGEVRDLIAKQFSDPSTGFDYKRYSDYVVRNYGGVQLYEQSVRDALAAQKLRSYVTAGAQVSEAEVKDDFMRDNTAFDVTYVPVNAQDLAEKITPSDEEMRQYFDAHKTDYRFLEPQKKIRYLFVSQDKVGQKLNISDEDLHKEYDSLKPENKMAGVRVQQIVLKVARPELDQEVLTKAAGLVAKIRNEDLTADAEAFAELARGNSEDPSTAKEGGWLPNPVKKNPNKKTLTPGNAAELAQNTLDWKEGQVGDPLKTGNAYYIFRRGPLVPKSFEDARQELLVSLRNRRSYAAAQAVAQKAQGRLNESHDVAKVAQEFAAEANMSPAEMTKETGFVKPGDDVPDIGSSPQFEEAIQPLEEPNQVGERVGVKNGFAIPMLAEKRDPRVPEFDEVKDKVATDLKRSRAGEQLEQIARDLASNSASPDALKAAAEKLGLKPQDEEGFHLGRPLGSAGADPSIDTAVYALKAGETTKTPVKVGETWVVLGVKKRDDAKTEDFDKRKSELVERAVNERREQVFDDFLTSARRRLEEQGDIQINRDTLAQLEETEAPAAIPQRPPITIPQGLQPQGK